MISIVCFGNELHADDGIGLAVHDVLMKLEMPRGVSLFYAGNAALDSVRYFEKGDSIVIVDAMQPQGKPGLIHRSDAKSLLKNVRIPNHLSLHSLSIPELLRMVEHLSGGLPEVELFAIEADSVKPFQPGLSCTVQKSIKPLARQVQRFVTQLACASSQSALTQPGLMSCA